MNEARLRGDGLAVAACAALLDRAGWGVLREGPTRPKLPVVLLNAASQQLLGDVFNKSELARGWYRIDQRIVRWGGKTVTLPHQAVALDEGELLKRIGVVDGGQGGKYVIEGAKPLPDGVGEVSFGERWAEAVAVRLKPDAAQNACWVEAVEGGWLFGVCVGEGRAWVLAVGGTLEELLEQSVLLQSVVGEVEAGRSRFDASPKIAAKLTGVDWMACGGAAMTFDPLCGEGMGHALREAILATAVLKAHAAGEPWEVLTRLYESRLKSGFRRHLQQCKQLYTSGGKGAWWQAQLTAMADQGMAVPVVGGRFRLEGFELVALRD
jgi:hypothetical protein